MLNNSESEMAWKFLAASPELSDEPFEESVVLLADEHFGVVINHPMNRTLGEIAPQFKEADFGDIPMYDGGPVGRTQITFAAWFKGKGGGFSFGISPEAAKKILDFDENAKLCAYLGYAGWSDGQLKSEIKDGTWLVSEADASLFLETNPEELWKSVVIKAIPEFALLNPPRSGAEERN